MKYRHQDCAVDGGAVPVLYMQPVFGGVSHFSLVPEHHNTVKTFRNEVWQDRNIKMVVINSVYDLYFKRKSVLRA